MKQKKLEYSIKIYCRLEKRKAQIKFLRIYKATSRLFMNFELKVKVLKEMTN